MLNCNFIATKPDLEVVLGYVFASAEFTVYEAYSEPEAELRTIGDAAELARFYPLGLCQGAAPSVLLQLVAKNSGSMTVERFALDPSKCNGKTYRHRSSGWGLIQLHLGGIGPRGLVPSHTNHNSQARALKWASTYPELPLPSTWNWQVVQAASGRLNRFIRKLAVSKEGNRHVLPDAARHCAVQ